MTCRFSRSSTAIATFDEKLAALHSTTTFEILGVPTT